MRLRVGLSAYMRAGGAAWGGVGAVLGRYSKGMWTPRATGGHVGGPHPMWLTP
jgi:hypothetical protein